MNRAARAPSGLYVSDGPAEPVVDKIDPEQIQIAYIGPGGPARANLW
jgi:hypothetical protein